ncbi:MAG: guanylate kinase [Candidatus Omnitrophica bacterium]|nr:guanylate kinase [Candidatus Omnitrophota bacterium]
MRRQGLIFVISGPSGSGKTTLLGALLKSPGLKKKLAKSISLTTRPKRSGEREGRDYFFISRSEFRKRRKEKKILEQTRYLGYDYATPKGFVENGLGKGKNILLCLDLRGALRIKRLYPERTITIFVAPPSIETLKGRIQQRCCRTKKLEVHQRLLLAKREISGAQRYDYCLTNTDFAKAIGELKQILLKEISKSRKANPWLT